MLQPCAVFLTLRLGGQEGVAGRVLTAASRWRRGAAHVPRASQIPCRTQVVVVLGGEGGAELGGGAPLSCSVEVRLLWTAETSCDLRAGF